METLTTHYLAFVGHDLIIDGTEAEVKACLRERFSSNKPANLLTFDGLTGRQTDINFEADDNTSTSKPVATSEQQPSKKRGRPKLGVIGREVTLLPRHWEWLDKQPGGASASLRRLIDQTRRLTEQQDLIRESQDKTHRFIFAIAGDLPGFEDATRALFAADKNAFMLQIKPWPKDVKHYAVKFSENAFIAC